MHRNWKSSKSQQVFRAAATACALACFWGCGHPQARSPWVFMNEDAEKRAAELESRLNKGIDIGQNARELGRILLAEGMVDEAISKFERARTEDPRDLETLLLFAIAVQKRNVPDFAQAVRLLEEAVTLDPAKADAHLSLAHAYDKLGKTGSAIVEFQKAAQLSHDPAVSVSTHLGLMAVYQRAGDVARAKAEYDAAYAIYPGVEEMIRQAEIRRVTPPPAYGAGHLQDEDGLHPPFLERIKRAQDELRKSAGEQQ